MIQRITFDRIARNYISKPSNKQMPENRQYFNNFAQVKFLLLNSILSSIYFS